MAKVGVDITQREYYSNNGTAPKSENWGTYQYMLLSDIINNFMLSYVGDDKVINKIDRNEVIFHAKRGLQEIHYDALREIAAAEFEVPDTLKLHLPHDFVGLVKIGYVTSDGAVRPIMQTHDTATPISYLQDNTAEAEVLMDNDNNALTGTPIIEENWTGAKAESLSSPDRASLGKRFGLETSKGNFNGMYHLDKNQGFIMFSSNLAAKQVVIEYVSDGMYGLAENEIKLNKMAETFMYNYITSAILNSKFGVQEYIVRRAKKEMSASLRNLKIRMQGLRLREITQLLRGRDKWIK